MMIENTDQRKFYQNGGFHASQEYQAPHQKTTEEAVPKLASPERENLGILGFWGQFTYFIFYTLAPLIP